MAEVIYDRSIFKQYFENSDPEILSWTVNVLEKLVQPGQIAKYIKRETEAGEATEFETLFEPLVKFFAYHVRLAREFRDFKDDEFLADQYLNNHGQFTCSDETLTQFQFLITNLLRIRAQRGATKMFEQSMDSSIPHGEMLRLLCWEENVFFKLGVARPQYNGWNVNNCSPLNRSLTGRYDLNLAWEYEEDIQSLFNYPIKNSNYVSIAPYRGKRCVHIENTPFGQEAGIKGIDNSKGIVIDPRLNYEITFYVAQDITLENLTFGCMAYDSAGSEISLLSTTVGESPRSYFFQTRRLNRAGTFYMIRGIVYNKDIDTLSTEEARLNIGFGVNLKSTANVVKIVPYIVMDNDMSNDSDSESDNFADSDSISFDGGSSGFDSTANSASGYWSDPSYDGEPSIFIWNVKVTPCNTAYSRCYLNNKNFVDIFSVNNSGKYSNQQIDNILRKYFIPYNTAFGHTHIGAISEVNPDNSYLLLEDGSYILLESEDRILLEQQ